MVKISFTDLINIKKRVVWGLFCYISGQNTDILATFLHFLNKLTKFRTLNIRRVVFSIKKTIQNGQNQFY